MIGRVTSHRVTSPIWGPPPSCKQALNKHKENTSFRKHFSHSTCPLAQKVPLLYVFHVSFIHVLIASLNFVRSWAVLFFVSRTMSGTNAWVKCLKILLLLRVFLTWFILAEKKVHKHFVDYFIDRLVTLPKWLRLFVIYIVIRLLLLLCL